MDTFAKRFREQRLKAGLSQEDIAAVCRNLKGEGMSRNAVSLWESQDAEKRTRPDFENLVSAARRMNVSLDYLVGLTDAAAKTKLSFGIDPAILELVKRIMRLPLSARKTIESVLVGQEAVVGNAPDKHAVNH